MIAVAVLAVRCFVVGAVVLVAAGVYAWLVCEAWWG
jgi:hypothetical protein